MMMQDMDTMTPFLPPNLTDKPWTVLSQPTIHNQSTISHSSHAFPAPTAPFPCWVLMSKRLLLVRSVPINV